MSNKLFIIVAKNVDPIFLGRPLIPVWVIRKETQAQDLIEALQFNWPSVEFSVKPFEDYSNPEFSAAITMIEQSTERIRGEFRYRHGDRYYRLVKDASKLADFMGFRLQNTDTPTAKRGSEKGTGVEATTIAEDETSILAKIPPLDKNNGEWVTAVAVARAGRALKLGIQENELSDKEAMRAVSALKSARHRTRAKVRSPSGDVGIDQKGRCFWADPDDRKVFWYLKSTTDGELV